MLTDFTAEYSSRSDGELLHLASARHSLVPEAAAALDAELRRRNLNESDRIEHKRYASRVERQEGRRETKLRPRWRRLGLKWELNWREILEMLAAMAIVVVAYLALPSRYHLSSDWQEAAFMVTLTSVGLVFIVRSWRNIAFWFSLGVSSVIHLFVMHAWTRKNTDHSRGEAKIGFFLGFVLFLLIYAAVRLLRRVFRSEEKCPTIPSGDGHVIE